MIIHDTVEYPLEDGQLLAHFANHPFLAFDGGVMCAPGGGCSSGGGDEQRRRRRCRTAERAS